MADPQNLTDGRADGAKLPWTASEKLGFYGATPVSQPSSSSFADVSKQTTQTTTALRTDLDAAIDCLNATVGQLRTMGLLTTS